MKFRKHQLDNGLEIIAECNPRAHSCALAYLVRTGSRDEHDANSGVSHFLEHMTFKGTDRRTAADVNRELDEIGGHANAFTSEEQTVYYVAVLPEYQLHALDLLTDIMRPSLRQADFDTEKQVILEEIAKYDDQPPFGAHEKSMAVHFHQHPLARSVLGTVDSVRQLTAEQMRAYFDLRYAPNNMVLAGAGNIDFDKVVEFADQHCGNWLRQSVDRDRVPVESTNDFRVFPHPVATQEYVIQIANGPAAEDDDRFAARLLSTAIGDDSGSRLFWELIDTGRAECAVVYSYEFEGAGIYATMLFGSPDQTASNLQQVLNVLKEVQRAGLSKEELEQACNKTCAQVVLQSERPANRLFSLGSAWLQRHEYLTVHDVVSSYRSVTLEDVRQVLTRFPLTNYSAVAVGPLTELNRAT